MRIDLARPADDAALLEFMKTTTLPGEITLAMQREPSLFAASPAMGEVHQILVARDGERIVGMAERAERRVHLDGDVTNLGYISGLRIHPDHRGSTALFKGFRFLRQLHEAGTTRAYLTTIARDNTTARDVLTSRRAGLPVYNWIGSYVTAAIPVRGRMAAASLPGIDVRSAAAGDLEELAGFFATGRPDRPCFPAIPAEDLRTGTGRVTGMSLADVLVARQGGRITGTLARWDQHDYKQWQLVSYGWKLTLLRPLFNRMARAFRWPRMPAPGTRIPVVMAALVAVAENDRGVFRSLLTTLLEREVGQGGQFLAIGMLEEDPFLPEVLALRPFTMFADAYLVTFDGAGERLVKDLERRLCHVELGTL